MGGIVGSITGLGSGTSGILGSVESEQQNLLNTQGQDEIDMLKNQEAQDKMQTSSQEATSWANTFNTISKEFSDLSQAKSQANESTAKASSDETKQA